MLNEFNYRIFNLSSIWPHLDYIKKFINLLSLWTLGTQDTFL